MKFLELIRNLKSIYTQEEYEKRDNMILYGVNEQPPPQAKHIIFSSMSDSMMNQLTCSYKRTIPMELLTLYREMNGAHLFWSTRQNKRLKLQIPFCCMSIFGVPWNSDRKHIEPYNISIEDLRRPNGTPEQWLKFGDYCKPDNYAYKYDLFVDTDTSRVFSVAHDAPECNIVETWETIDDCLCAIFVLLSALGPV